MTLDQKLLERLRFLARVIQKECRHLALTDQRLFSNGFTLGDAEQLESNPDLAERVEAFVGRFGRLQDTLGDKLLPVLLTALGERTAAVIDNLDRAERLGFVKSADEWMVVRNLRNKMVHEYIEDTMILYNALQKGHEFVPVLIATTDKMISEIERKQWTLI